MSYIQSDQNSILILTYTTGKHNYDLIYNIGIFLCYKTAASQKQKALIKNHYNSVTNRMLYNRFFKNEKKKKNNY